MRILWHTLTVGSPLPGEVVAGKGSGRVCHAPDNWSPESSNSPPG